MRRCAVVLAAALISVTALAGCGSAADEASDAADETSSSSTGDTEDPSPDTDDTGGDAGDEGADKGDEPDADKGDEADRGENKPDDAKKDSDDGKTGDDGTNSSSAEYCGLVKRLKTDFNPSNTASLQDADLDSITDRLQEITDESPNGIAADWQRVTSAFKSFAAKLDKYGVDLSDPQGFANLKPKEQKAIQAAMQNMSSLSTSTKAIGADVQRTCGIAMQ